MSYSANQSYSFNGVVLEVVDRRMQRNDSISYEAATERPQVVGQCRLAVETLREANELARLLSHRLHMV